MFDVAIVGAGPAGATLAKLISSKLNILLLDKRQLDFSKEISLNHRDKCCGGLLAPDAQKIVEFEVWGCLSEGCLGRYRRLIARLELG